MFEFTFTSIAALFRHEDNTPEPSEPEVPAAFSVGMWSVSVGDEQAFVNISSLPSNNGSAITDIEYQLDEDAFVSTGGIVDFTISDLVNDASYDIGIRAVNAVGAGSVSDVKSFMPVSSDTVPAQFGPAQWNIAAGDEEAAISILELPNDGGTAITDVEYQVDDGSFVSAGTTSDFDITGLVNATSYDINIRAVNVVGEGPASAAKTVTPVEPDTIPDAFTVGQWTITAGNGDAFVDISSLPDDGGSTITNIAYQVDATSPVAVGGTGDFTISDLTNGVEYDVRLYAINAVGTSAASDIKAVTPVQPDTVPDAFTIGDWSVVADDTTASVTISQLPDDGGSTITAIEYQLDNTTPVEVDPESFVITGLVNDQTYDILIRAINAIGTSADSDVKEFTPEAEEVIPDPVPLGIDGTWSMTLRDEFDQLALDLDIWTPNWLDNDPNAITPPVNDLEEAAYDPAQVVFEDGILKLKTIASPVTVGGVEYPYRSGIIQSYSPSPGKFLQKHGAFEALIWFDNDGTGDIPNFPAWWLNGTENPAHGEIDTVEGRDGMAKWAYHTTPYFVSGPDNLNDMTGWHTYGVEWSIGTLRFYYDGVQVGQVSHGVVSTDPLFLVLNHGISEAAGGTTKVPSEMGIDYVRVWEKVEPAIHLVGLGGGIGAGGAALSITMPDVEADDLILVAGGLPSTTGFGTNPAGWTSVGTATQGSVRGSFWRKDAVGNEADTVVSFPNGSSGQKTGGAFAYRGVGDISVVTSAVGDATNPYQVNITTTEDNTFVVVLMYIDGSTGSPVETDWVGTGGVRFDAAYLHPTNGDWAIAASGFFAAAGTYTVGITATESTVINRPAVLTALSLVPVV